MAQLSN